MPARTAEATWDGAVTDGSGTYALESGAYDESYSYASRFEDARETNPEELIGAVHAGCYAMARRSNW